MSAMHKFRRNVLVGVRTFCTRDMTVMTIPFAGIARQNSSMFADTMAIFSDEVYVKWSILTVDELLKAMLLPSLGEFLCSQYSCYRVVPEFSLFLLVSHLSGKIYSQVKGCCLFLFSTAAADDSSPIELNLAGGCVVTYDRTTNRPNEFSICVNL